MGLLKAGTYEVKVKSTVLVAAENRTPYIYVVFADAVGDEIGWKGWLTERALPYTLKSLETLGWNREEAKGDISTLNGTTRLVGRDAEIVVQESEYQGKPQVQVRWINEPNSSGARRKRAMPLDEAQHFAAMIRAKILTAKMPEEERGPVVPEGNVEDDPLDAPPF